MDRWRGRRREERRGMEGRGFGEGEYVEMGKVEWKVGSDKMDVWNGKLGLYLSAFNYNINTISNDGSVYGVGEWRCLHERKSLYLSCVVRREFASRESTLEIYLGRSFFDLWGIPRWIYPRAPRLRLGSSFTTHPTKLHHLFTSLHTLHLFTKSCVAHALTRLSIALHLQTLLLHPLSVWRNLSWTQHSFPSMNAWQG